MATATAARASAAPTTRAAIRTTIRPAPRRTEIDSPTTRRGPHRPRRVSPSRVTRALHSVVWGVVALATMAACRGTGDHAAADALDAAVANVLRSVPADDEDDAQVKALAALGAPA